MKRSEILLIKHTRVIEDPFPEESLVQSIELEEMSSGFFSRFFKPNLIKSSISIWKAYQMGYDKAYEEILSHCED